MNNTQAGWPPVCGAVLLCILSLISIRAWQGADLAAEAHGLTGWTFLQPVAPEARRQRSRPDTVNLQRAEIPNSASHINPATDFLDKLTFSDIDDIADWGDEAANDWPASSTSETTEATPIAYRIPKDRFRNGGRRLREIMDDSVQWINEQHSFVSTQIQSIAAKMDQGDQRPSRSTTAATAQTIGFQESSPPATRTPAIAAQPTADQPAVSPRQTPPKWIQPRKLLKDLESLGAHPLIYSWSQSTTQIIRGLESLDGIADPNSRIIFEQLQHQLDQLDFITVQVSTSPARSASDAQGSVATQLRQLRYAIQRRLAVWPVVHQLAQRQVNRISLIDNRQVAQFLQASQRRLNIDDVEQGWAGYLLLPEAVSAFNAIKPNEFEQKKAARAVLARMYSPTLSAAQSKYIHSVMDDATIDILQASATELVDLQRFLLRLEKLELYDNGASQFYLNDDYQSLLWSGDPELQQLAQVLQTHYRNANFRVSVSEELMNRMIPQLPSTKEPYRDRILGASVVGQTQISNQLRVSLIPDAEQISMRLETIGNVLSKTTATRSGIVVENEGNSRFRVIKRLAFGQHGISAYRPETTSQTNQRVVGLRSSLDLIPPLGWIARRIAHNKIQQQAPITEEYTRSQLESQAESRFESEIEEKLDELDKVLTANLLHPLVALDLEPDPVQIHTTEERINMRYRLAGRDQMSASTARPRALRSSLMSIQIHESALNNLMNRAELAGNTFTTDELLGYLGPIFKKDLLATTNGKQRKQSTFEFAPFDPFRVDFEEDKISLSVNLKSFRIGNGKRWRNLRIKATYDPQVNNGFRIGLTQSEEGLDIRGKRLNVADQLAIGVICEVLFPKQFEFGMMPTELGQKLSVSSLEATQFVVSNGWIGLSVDDAASFAMPTNQAFENRLRPLLRKRR